MRDARTDLLQRASDLCRDQQWAAARATLLEADAEQPLGVEHLERLASTSYLLGRDEESAEAWSRAHQECLAAGDRPRAARCAFWAAFGHLLRGEMAQAGGWLATASALLETVPPDCVEHGYVLVPAALQTMLGGDPSTAREMFRTVGEIGARCADADLVAFGLFGEGQALIALGETARGMACLDEVMVSVTSGQVAPSLVGLVYCGVIDACHLLYDVRRAGEWTVALSRWCQAQPDLVAFRGQCLVHRSEILQLHGEWQEAIAAARQAIERLSRPPHPSVGAAWYRRAELHRLRGEPDRAAAAYRSASQWGHAVQPGLALLRLAQGEVDVAGASIRLALEETDDLAERGTLLSAAVEILLAADDVPAARSAADELGARALRLGAPYVEALAALADGSVLVAEGDPRAALRSLRRAWTAWRDLDTPYECARARLLIGIAFRMLGDDDSAEMEFDAARWVFEELSAVVDLARLDRLGIAEGEDPGGPPPAGHGLTGRELEILAQLATGRTNRAIAAELIISDKTVARHVANIFTKLGVSSRAAATAYAFQHDLA